MKLVLPARKCSNGRTAHGNRIFINAVFGILRTGVPWHDLPLDYGEQTFFALLCALFTKIFIKKSGKANS